MQSSEHDDGSDGGAREFGGDIRRDSGEAQYIDLEHLSGAARRFEILAAVIPQTKIQALSGGGLFDDVGMPFELASNRRADEIGPVLVKAVLDHQIDMAKIDVAEIDRDLLAVTWLRS